MSNEVSDTMKKLADDIFVAPKRKEELFVLYAAAISHGSSESDALKKANQALEFFKQNAKT